MHKLSLYLNPSQYSALETLAKGNDIEEYANELFYSALSDAVIEYMCKDEDEDTYLVAEDVKIGDLTVDIYFNEDRVLLGCGEESVTLQRIGGKLNYVLESGERVLCTKEDADEFERILEKIRIKLPDMSTEQLNENII